MSSAMSNQRPTTPTPAADHAESDEVPVGRHLYRSAPRPIRWGAWVALALVLLLLALAAVAAWVVRRPLPEVDGEVTVPGLVAEVEVLRDDHGVPHVYADTDADLM